MNLSYLKDYEEQLANKGFVYGTGRISTDHQYQYISIPKNASSSTVKLLELNNWQPSNYTTLFHKHQYLIIIRDPVERWVSGIAEYIYGHIASYTRPGIQFINDYSKAIENLIFDQIVFDDHTMPQYYFYTREPFNSSEATFMWMCQNLHEKIKNVFDLKTFQMYNENISIHNNDKKLIKDFFQDKIESNVTLKTKIKNRYRRDYEIFEKISII